MSELSRVHPYLWKYKWTYLLGFLFVLANNYFGALIPRVVQQAVDLIEGKQAVTYLNLFESGSDVNNAIAIAAGLILALTFLKAIFMFFQRQTIIVNSHKIVADLRTDIYKHYQALDQMFYKRNRTGDLMSRVAEDVGNVRGYVGPALMYIVNMFALFVFVIFQMLRADVKLTLWTLLPLPLLSLCVYFVSSIMNRKNVVIQKQLSALTAFSQEAYSGIRVIKSYAREKNFGKFFEAETESFKQKTMSLVRTEAFFFPLIIFLIGLSTLIMLYVGGQQYDAGLIGSGTLVQFVIYIGMLTWPVIALGWVASTIQKASASQRRINEFMTVQPLVNDGKLAETEVDLDGDLVFSNVSFTYEDSGIQALTDISLAIKKGEKIAIIGRTGCGKTTIADLILRVFNPDSGTIELNNTAIKDLSIKQLRQFVGYVPQDVFLFSDTVANNIALGSERQVSADEIAYYAKKAAVAADIERFPNKYETMVGERGVTLSGGQKQRISIARALIKNPSLLILDDALSAVDAKTEHHIMEEFKEVLDGKTVIIITHRIFTLFDVDRIYVMQEGRIVEQGSHDELYASKGRYYDLYELQNSEEVVD